MSENIDKKAYYAILFEYYKELLTDKQIEQFSQTLKPLINFDYVCAVLNKEGKMIAYGLVAPSVGHAFQKGKGHLQQNLVLQYV